MGVSRGAIYYNKGLRVKRYKKKTDKLVLEEIKAILADRPSYGYKRVTALINKARKANSLPIYSKKRVLRVMQINGLTIKHKNPRREHKKTGKIITLHSNTRWCSDGFEIHCFNGEKVYVAFTLDCCDRECISYVASKDPLAAQDIQDLMVQSIAERFPETIKAERQIQYLSDRGSIYRAYETIKIGRQLGLKSCFTAAYSPQSNGMAEAFVNTIKRDYVYTNDCVDANTVIKMLDGWLHDYNNIAPHSGLGMKSPVEYKNLTK